MLLFTQQLYVRFFNMSSAKPLKSERYSYFRAKTITITHI